MEYFFYCRDVPDSLVLREPLIEEHLAFTDPYEMIARGPTLHPDDEEIPTGSMHVVDVPDAAAARVFAFEEPNYRAGVYEKDVLIRRWDGLTDRTMWEYTGAVPGYGRFLVLGHGRPGAAPGALADEQRAHLTAGDRLIVGGELLSEDDDSWTGTALMVELPDLAAAEAVLPGSPYGRAGLYERVEVFPWRFGGRIQD